MKQLGVVSAGSPGTARVGAEILRRGGNAVDAVCASCLATSIHEPVLTSLAGGGVMLVHQARTGKATVLDFFSNAPGLDGPPPEDLDFNPVTVDFGGAEQVFHIGRASAAVPSTLCGLGAAHERYGRLPLAELVEPVCRELREGVVLDAFHASTFKLLAPILVASPSSKKIYAPDGALPLEGERYANPLLAATLEQMARQGITEFVHEVLQPLLVEQFGPAAGGRITARDLEQYEVRFMEPLVRRYRGREIATHVWPSHGGTLVATVLAMLEPLAFGPGQRHSREHLMALGAAQRVANAVKADGGDPFTGGHLEGWRRSFEQLRQDPSADIVPPARPGPGHTTHISAVDRDGNAASVTISYGEGCGHALGETGIALNNFMGEADLHPEGFHQAPPGTRLQTNMCPTRLIDGDRLVVLGSGGANRIRTAIAQVILNLVDFGMSFEDAVAAGRLHIEGGVVDVELFDLPDPGVLEELAGGDTVQRFDAANMFFGGVHLAARDADGHLYGAGDPRRSGSVEIV